MLALLTAAVGGEFGLRWMVIATSAAAIISAVAFLADRCFQLIYIRLIAHQLQFDAGQSPDQPAVAQTPRLEGEIARRRQQPARSRSIRLLAVWFLVQPLLVAVPLAFLLGEPILTIGIGFVLGFVASGLLLTAWQVWRAPMARNGFRW
jgi:hypothetical protein